MLSQEYKSTFFQRSLFCWITTLLSWLKSTLLLKIECFGTTIHMKTQCLQINEIQHYSRKKRCLRSEVRKRKGRINLKFNYARGSVAKFKLKMSADNFVTWLSFMRHFCTQYFDIAIKIYFDKISYWVTCFNDQHGKF